MNRRTRHSAKKRIFLGKGVGAGRGTRRGRKLRGAKRKTRKKGSDGLVLATGITSTLKEEKGNSGNQEKNGTRPAVRGRGKTLERVGADGNGYGSRNERSMPSIKTKKEKGGGIGSLDRLWKRSGYTGIKVYGREKARLYSRFPKKGKRQKGTASKPKRSY